MDGIQVELKGFGTMAFGKQFCYAKTAYAIVGGVLIVIICIYCSYIA